MSWPRLETMPRKSVNPSYYLLNLYWVSSHICYMLKLSVEAGYVITLTSN